MDRKRVSDAEFVRLFESKGPDGTAAELGIGVRRVYERRRRIEGKLGRRIQPPAPQMPKKLKVTPEVVENLVLERLGADAFREEYRPVVRWSLESVKPNAPGTPVFFISDWHYGEVVVPEQVQGTNRYDTALAEKRLHRVIQTGTMLLKQHLAHGHYPGVVLVLGGDMIAGHLRDEDLVSGEVPPLVQVQRAARILADAVAFLHDEFGKVDLYCVPGNHGRLTRKPWAKFYAQQNLDWLVYQLLADYVRHLPGVVVNAPPVRDMTFTVANRRFRLSHGDQFRGGDGIIGPLGPVIRGDVRKRVAAALMPGQPERYDTLLVGHFHSLCMLPRVIINGSIKGYDEFALSIGAPWEPAQQALFTVHPRYGITWLVPIYADDEFNQTTLERAA